MWFWIFLCHSSANWLTPWLMEPGGSMPHSQGLSNNPCPETNQPNYPHWYLSPQGSFQYCPSHLRLGVPKGLFPVGLPVKILKALLPSHILATCPAHLNLLDLITLTLLGERYKLWSSSLWSLLHSQILASGSCLQIPLAWIPPLM